MSWAPLLWLAGALVLLAFLERWIHRHLQGVALLIAGDRELAVVLYALPLLPGVVLHELSHAGAAILLGARIGTISLRPRVTGQRIQLGFVPVEKTGPLRASLIGLAPLVVGCGVILLIGQRVFGLETIGASLAALDWTGLMHAVQGILRAPDAWVWFYVIFAIGNTMMPSRSDRQYWVPVIVLLCHLAVLIWIAGLGPAIAAVVAGPVGVAVRWLAAMTTLTVLIDVPFTIAIALSERLLSHLKGAKVRYGT